MIYRDIHASLMRFCSEFAESFTVGVNPTFTNFDATWDEAELPKQDLMGYFALSFAVDSGFVDGTFQVGYSTYDDTNLFRLVEAMDAMMTHLLPSCKIPVVDADTGAPKGFMVCKNGTRLMPAVGAKNRPVQFIAVQFATTTTYQLTGEVWDSV